MNKQQLLLNTLSNIDWNVVAKTFGNNHSTLIGLFVQWWIGLDPQKHTVLEGGPSNGYTTKSKKRGQCDALLLKDDKPVGVLEVEGGRYLLTANKIGYFFDAKYDDLSTLRLGILVLYPTTPKGRGEKRQFYNPIDQDIIQTIKTITKEHPNHDFILVGINKSYERLKNGVRSINDYYRGNVNKVYGSLFNNGFKVHELVFFEKQHN